LLGTVPTFTAFAVFSDPLRRDAGIPRIGFSAFLTRPSIRHELLVGVPEQRAAHLVDHPCFVVSALKPAEP